MTKPHISLRPSTNIILIIVWAALAIISISKFNPWPFPIIVAGTIFGVLGGIMQLLSMNEGRVKFLNALTLLDIRALLKSSKWGKRYIYFLWSTSIGIFVLSLSTKQPLWALFAGYFSMSFFRDLITLKSTYELTKLDN